MPKRRSSGIDLRLRLTQNLPGTDRMARSGLASGVFLRVELPQELVTACRPVGVLLHRLLEEGGHVLVPGVAGVADVLAVVVARLEGVVLHRDEIEDNVAEACLTCCHRCSPHWYRLVADALRLPLADGVNRPAPGSASGSHRTGTDSFVSTTSLPGRVGIREVVAGASTTTTARNPLTSALKATTTREPLSSDRCPPRRPRAAPTNGFRCRTGPPGLEAAVTDADEND